MKRPKRSSPHTPINTTLKLRWAAPQAKIAEEEPRVNAAVSTSFSTWPNSGATSPVRSKSGLISPATRISKGLINVYGLQHLQTLDVFRDSTSGDVESSIGFVPIEWRLGSVEIRVGSCQCVAERCEPRDPLERSGPQKF